MGNETPWWYRPSEAKRHLRTNVVRAGASPERDPSVRHWIEQHAPRLHIPLLARGRASRSLVPVSALLALTLLLAARPGVGADATCDVPPINLTSATGEDNASVVLTWESSGECTPDEYAIYRRDMDVEGSRMTKIASVDGDVLTHTDTTVTAGEDYRYRIRSNDQGSRSGRTDITIPEAAVNEPEPEPVPEPTQRSTRQNFDVTPPSLQVVNVDGTSLVLIYDELLDESSTPATTDYTVDIGGSDYTPSSVVVRGAEVALTLSTGAASGDTVTLDYSKGTSPVKDLAANEAVAESNRPVTNHTGATNDRPEFSSETIAISVDENTPIMTAFADAVTATDDDTGDTLTYSLPANVLLLFGVGANTGQFSTFAPLDFESTSSYVVPLYVRDSKGPAGGADSIFDDSIKVTINVNDVNEAPTISGASFPDVDENTTTVRTYTASDPDAGSTLLWSIDSDTSVEENQDGSLFQIGQTTGELSFISAPDYETPGSMATPPANTYQVTIKVTDNGSPQQSDTFEIVVNVDNVNEPPDITTTGATFTSISKAEGTGPSDPLATYAADDPEDDTLTWTLSGPDEKDFTITSAGVLRFQALTDYEDPRDAGTNNVYNVTVEVKDTDGSAVDDSIDVVVTITNIDEAGTVTLPGTITAGQAVTATLTDHDGTVSNVTWQWSRADTALGSFTPISGATSNPYTTVAADVGKYLKAEASYTDPHGSGKSATSAASSQVAVGNVNPSFSSMTATRSVPENSGAAVNVGAAVAATPGDSDPLHYWLTGDDASSFDIVSTSGQIQTKSGVTYDFEGAKKTYSVTVNVRDNKDLAGNTDSATDDSITVTINLSNVDEPGTVTITGTEEGGATLMASVTDIDGTVTSVSWQWALGASASGPFAPISGATNDMYTTVAVDVNRYLRATASYTDPQGSGKSASAVTGQIAASNNEPEFPSSETGSRSLAENSGGGVNVGAPVAAEDDDSDSLTYSLSGTDASSFEIVATSGQIRTKSGITYNYESKSVYGLSVHVHDNKDAASNSPHTTTDDTINVTISLTDVNETPTIETTTTSMSVAENQTGVLTYAADDPDNDNNESHDSANTLTWSVESADDGGFFEIGSTSGVLTFKNAPNFEDRQDAGGDGVYNVTVTVTDNGIDGARGASNHLSVSKSLAVTVTDVNETPTLTTAPATATFDENATGVVATYIATDPDATTGTMSWDLQGNDAGDFNITSTVNGTAELTFKSPPDYEMPDDTGTNNVYDVTVRVRDNASPRLEDTQSVAVTVNDLNETPVVAGDAGPSFAEIEFDHTATASELEIGTYTATDDDNADNAGLQTITFDVSGTDAAHFSIDASTGVLSFSIEPDFENPSDLADSNMMGASDNMYEIVVEADDGAGESNSVGTFPVTVTVTNVNETPEVPLGVPDEDFAEIEWDADSADLDVMTYIPRDEEISDLTQLSWSLDGTDAADFQITEDSTTGHGTLSFRNRPNFENPTDRVNTAESHMADDNMYEVIVKISDGPNTREYPTTVTVTNMNETPGFTAVSTGRHADEIEYDSGITAADMSSIPATVANQAYWYRVEARDEEGDDIIWTITGPDSADFVIAEDADFVMTADADESAIARWSIVPDFENPMGSSTDVGANGYVYTVNASDGTNTAMHSVFVRIFDVNERPEFTGTVETAIALDEHDATLDESSQEPPYAFPTIASYTARDEEGGVRWSLTGTDAADFEIDSGGNVVFRETPSFEDPKDSGGDNVYNFTVVVTDIDSKSNRRTAMEPVSVTVEDVEEEGHVAIAEGDESPGVDDSVTFELTDPDGEIDVDRTGDPRWQVQRETSGSWSTVSTVITGAASYSYTVQEGDAGHQLRVMVTYKDRRGEDKMATSAPTDVVTMDPRANVPPRLRSGVFTTSEGPAIIDFGFLDATDRDGDNITFAMLEQQDYALFELSETGRLRAIQALDFEDGSTLSITVTLSDGKGLDSNGDVIDDDSVDVTTGVSVILFDVEEEGVITFSPLEPEAGTAQAATVTDDDGGVTGRSWQWWRSQDGRTGWSPISGATDNSYTPTVNDEDFYLRASVEYTDRRGGGKRAEAITGPVPSENRRPLFPTSETGQRSVDENSRAGTNVGPPVAAEDPERDRLTYSLSGADAASFTITSTGQIRVGSGTTLDFETKSSYSVTVEVHDGKDGTGATSSDIDDTQDVTITVVNLEEPGTVTLSSETATIQARVPVTASLEDDDGPRNITWQWSRSRSSTSGWANIAGATSATFTPDDADIGGYIRAIASYDDGEDVGKTAVKVSPRVGQPPPVNSAPAFPATERGQRELAEDATGGIAVGDPVAATDFNNDTLRYTLSGTDAALFTIGSNDGQLRVASGAELDFETKRTLRVTVEVTDGANALGDPDDDAIDDRQNVTITLTDVNEAPVVSGDTSPSVEENTSAVVATYRAADPERDTLVWSVNSNDFWISSSGQLYFRSTPDYENRGTSFSIRVTAKDPDELEGHLDVTVTVTDVEEPGVVTITPLRGWIGTRFEAELIDGDDSVTGETWKWERSRNRSSWEEITGASQDNYTADGDDVGHYLRATVSYSDRRGGNKEAAAETRSLIGEAQPTTTNSAPGFDEASTTRSIRQGSGKGRPVGAPVKAEDPDHAEVLTYELEGSEEEHFTIDPVTGQIWTKDVLVEGEEYSVNVEVRDGFDDFYNPNDGVDDSIEVVITVTGGAFVRSGSSAGGGGGGGGAPAVPVPSEADFDWNVTRDLEELDPDNENPTGIWSDGQTIWVLENSTTGPDRVFAYDLLTGDRLEDAEFELDARNRFSHGLWSDGETVWIADSGQDKLFAYRLRDGARLPDRDLDLDERNRDPRGIWSDGTLMYVVDSVKDALFVYDLSTGALLAEYELDSLNRSPRGVWSDGVTIWISDDGAKRVFAYRIEDGQLKRLEEEEFGFRSLLKAGNGDGRGIWSDLTVLLVADAKDARLYSYNMPDAIDARLASLSLSSVDIGPFSPLQTDYRGRTTATLSTVEATAAQDEASVVIAPADADGDDANGHQVMLSEGAQISVTVTSPDGSRERVYRVTIEIENRAPQATALPSLRLKVGEDSARIDLATYFSDPDGDPLSYTLGQSLAPNVADATVANGVLSVTPIAPGRTSLNVSASDGSLSSEASPLMVTVEPVEVLAPEVRVAARRVQQGRFEFALQVRSAEGQWQDRILPRRRFLPAASDAGRWLNSNAFNVGEGNEERTIRITARRVSGGRVEFAIQLRSDDGGWGDRLLPTQRFLRITSPMNRWFVSTPLDTGQP